MNKSILNSHNILGLLGIVILAYFLYNLELGNFFEAVKLLTSFSIIKIIIAEKNWVSSMLILIKECNFIVHRK